MACRQFTVSGRVQGVFFRASTRDVATGLGLTGHAINLPDGRVEVLACGPVDEVFTQENLRKTYGGRTDMLAAATKHMNGNP